ncbi:unnamed protein product, partial [Amoebophrya sp. A120]
VKVRKAAGEVVGGAGTTNPQPPADAGDEGEICDDDEDINAEFQAEGPIEVDANGAEAARRLPQQEIRYDGSSTSSVESGDASVLDGSGAGTARSGSHNSFMAGAHLSPLQELSSTFTSTSELFHPDAEGPQLPHKNPVVSAPVGAPHAEDHGSEDLPEIDDESPDHIKPDFVEDPNRLMNHDSYLTFVQITAIQSDKHQTHGAA